MKALRSRSVLLTLAMALLLLGALLTPAPALGTDFCRFLDRFPATGQETSYTPGDDGDVQAGGPLRYRDLGNGTILDKNTLLIWEKLCGEGPPDATCPAVHDVDTQYSWANAFAEKIAALNTSPCFAGHCDWRLPNVKELLSIVNYENNVAPLVSEAFDNSCTANCSVLTCSCTAASFYWSSTSNAGVPTGAWFVNFSGGDVDFFDKNGNGLVRAVRGGCVD